MKRPGGHTLLEPVLLVVGGGVFFVGRGIDNVYICGGGGVCVVGVVFSALVARSLDRQHEAWSRSSSSPASSSPTSSSAPKP